MNISTVTGIKNALFGAGGLFLASLTGPGRVWLQSMTMPHLAHEIGPNQGYMVHRHGFMCATPGVQFSICFQQRLGAGVFTGFPYTTLFRSGQGQAWVELHGEVVAYDLQPGNTLRVHPGHVGMYQESVQFNITTFPGIKTAFFGGVRFSLLLRSGPGRVWLQSMTMQHLAHAIQ